MHNQEQGGEVFFEQVKAEMAVNAQKIRERNTETLQKNFDTTMKVLENLYIAEKSKKKVLGIFTPRRETLQEGLQTKSKQFQADFDESIFSTLVHYSNNQIDGDEQALVTLKSPSMIATEHGKSAAEVLKHQGPLDALIGSNDLVFANAEALRSRSASGAYGYKIDSDEGYVVPLDIADVLPPLEVKHQRYSDAMQVYLISKNLYSAEQFKKVFSTYCAVMFDTPDEALTFFKFNYFLPQRAGVWESDEQVTRGIGDEKEKEAAKKMRMLLVKFDVLPPFSPEWQFKGSVKAAKIH